MTKFRYRILDIKWMGQHSKIEAVLNEAGDEGWEAIDLRWNAGSHDFVTVTMRQTTPETGVAQVNQFMWEHRDGRVVALPEGAQPDPARTQALLPGNYKTQPSSQGGGQAIGPALNLSPPAPVDTSDA